MKSGIFIIICVIIIAICEIGLGYRIANNLIASIIIPVFGVGIGIFGIWKSIRDKRTRNQQKGTDTKNE